MLERRLGDWLEAAHRRFLDYAVDGGRRMQRLIPDLATIPGVVLTSSEGDEDIARSPALHANSYVTKPVDFGRFCGLVRSIEEYWFTLVRLPAEEAAPK